MNPIRLIQRGLSNLGYFTIKHAPELLLAGGIGCSVTAIVVAVNETPKAEAAIAMANTREDTSVAMTARGAMTDSELRQDRIQIKSQMVFEVAKIYSPAIALEGASIGMLIWSHCIMKKRLRAMAMAYTALNTAFAQYRGRIRQLYGNEVDQYALTGVQKAELPEGTVIDGEVTKEKTETKLLPGTVSPYARYFDANNDNWKNNMDLNMMFIRGAEHWAKQRLHIKGYLFLNDLYQHLGFPPTPEGQIVGWWDDPSTGDADVHIMVHEGVRALSDGNGGYVHAILIDPNVDGPIYERLRTVKPLLTQLTTPDNRAEIGIAHPEGVQLYG